MIKQFLAGFAAAAMACAPAHAVMVQIPAQGFMLPGNWQNGPTVENNYGNIGTNSAANHKIAFYGRVYQKDPAFRSGVTTKNLVHVSFSTGNKTCTGCTSVVQVDIEGVSANAGPPGQPDGTILGGGNAKATVALSAITNQAWFTATPQFAAPAVVSYGQPIAVVFSFSSYYSGAFTLWGGNVLSDISGFGPNISTFNGTGWAAGAAAPNITLEFDDGSVGTLAMTQPYQQTQHNDTFNSAGNPSEIGMPFQLPYNAQIDQLCAAITVADAGTTGVIELTDSQPTPKVMASVAWDGHTSRAAGGKQGLSCFPIPVQSIARNATYYVGVKATSAAGHTVTVSSLTVGAASAFDAGQGAGQKFAYATRSGGSWSATTTTRRPYMAIIVSALDDGTGP